MTIGFEAHGIRKNSARIGKLCTAEEMIGKEAGDCSHEFFLEANHQYEKLLVDIVDVIQG